MSDEPLGNIGHDRTGSALSLSAEAHILLPSRILPNRMVDLARELSGSFQQSKSSKRVSFIVLVYLVRLVYLAYW
jgi:hypothetical protein